MEDWGWRFPKQPPTQYDLHYIGKEDGEIVRLDELIHLSSGDSTNPRALTKEGRDRLQELAQEHWERVLDREDREDLFNIAPNL